MQLLVHCTSCPFWKWTTVVSFPENILRKESVFSKNSENKWSWPDIKHPYSSLRKWPVGVALWMSLICLKTQLKKTWRKCGGGKNKKNNRLNRLYSQSTQTVNIMWSVHLCAVNMQPLIQLVSVKSRCHWTVGSLYFQALLSLKTKNEKKRDYSGVCFDSIDQNIVDLIVPLSTKN